MKNSGVEGPAASEGNTRKGFVGFVSLPAWKGRKMTNREMNVLRIPSLPHINAL